MKTTLVDAVLGASAAALDTAGRLERRLRPLSRPVATLVLHPPLVPRRHQPGRWLERAVSRGRDTRIAALEAVLGVWVPSVTAELLRRLDLTEVVLEHVDLDAVVAAVDIERVIERLDLDAVAERLDVDAVAARLDLAAVVHRLDLMAIVRDELDLDALVAGVDLDAAAARLDVEQVIDRVDLARLAEKVMAQVDLPEIIRESTGSVTSSTVRGMRMQGISGDEAVDRAVGRLLRGRGRHHEVVPGDQ